ncbi:REP-associated tyrosine transposase [Catenovulum sediminis]|uniref:REP-associated tyrosine transposase n=1 Tax=Catenovulum sediminis TaxID=1740262 RepID=UPI001180B78E|nr:transposase [Catenovulum sediminis]
MSWNDLRKGRFSQANREYFVTFVTKKRAPLFSDFCTAQTFCQQISVNESKFNCKWLTWVLMPDHFHGLVQLNTANLPPMVGHLKGLSAYRVNLLHRQSRHVWQPSFYEHALRKDEDRKNIARYIVANPLRRNLVKSVRCYPFWDSVYL